MAIITKYIYFFNIGLFSFIYDNMKTTKNFVLAASAPNHEVEEKQSRRKGLQWKSSATTLKR